MGILHPSPTGQRYLWQKSRRRIAGDINPHSLTKIKGEP